MMKRIKTILTLTMILTFGLGQLMAQSDADRIIGKWLNEEKDAKVEIYKQGDEYFGKIVWLKNPNNDDGTPKLDIENPEEELQSRAVQGLLMLKDFEYDGDDEWEDGEIYDPKSGKTYSCYMELEEPTKLMIKGYIGVKWIGRTTYWSKAD
ncbi:MAG: DUF2147 domain-containing protein [Bacteroidales bacterium]|nr:DUF2147 domain-containing protein [Bacteroidales bacterium]